MDIFLTSLATEAIKYSKLSAICILKHDFLRSLEIRARCENILKKNAFLWRGYKSEHFVAKKEKS